MSTRGKLEVVLWLSVEAACSGPRRLALLGNGSHLYLAAAEHQSVHQSSPKMSTHADLVSPVRQRRRADEVWDWESSSKGLALAHSSTSALGLCAEGYFGNEVGDGRSGRFGRTPNWRTPLSTVVFPRCGAAGVLIRHSLSTSPACPFLISSAAAAGERIRGIGV
nr:unnamed protein product [Digitaria exilis]